MSVEKVANKLRPADRKALLSTPGRGAFSSASWTRLRDAGLMDENFYPTDLGLEVIAELRAGAPQ